MLPNRSKIRKDVFPEKPSMSNRESVFEEEFFNLKRKTANTQDNVTEMIRKSISAEISQMSFKILVGFILVSVIVFSMVQFGRAMQFFLSQLENGYVYEIIACESIAVISCILLYSLFHTQSAEENFEVETSLVNRIPKSLGS